MRVSEISKANISIYTSSVKGGTATCKYTFDLSSLRDPIGQKELIKGKTSGRDPDIRRWVREDGRVNGIVAQILLLAYAHVKAAKESYLSIRLIDHHGKWISPAVAEDIADVLASEFFDVMVINEGIVV